MITLDVLQQKKIQPWKVLAGERMRLQLSTKGNSIPFLKTIGHWIWQHGFLSVFERYQGQF